MSGSFSRRDWLKTVGVAGAGALIRIDKAAAGIAPPIGVPAPGEILDLNSTSDVFIPPRGDSWQKFSFDFPEPAVEIGGYRFSFLIFTDENTYGLKRSHMAIELTQTGGIFVGATRFVFAGGQGEARGRFGAGFRIAGSTVEWGIVAEMDRPIKSITTVVRGMPRGKISFGGGELVDHGDNDVAGGYAFAAGDLHGDEVPATMSTPIAIVQAGEQDFRFISSLDDRVRPKRYYFQAGEHGYRVEAVYEHDAWRNDTKVSTPTWRLGRASSFDAAMQPHVEHIEQAFDLRTWETRPDVPAWMRKIALVTTLHGMHYTGFIFNDYARQLEILRWIATEIAAERVLVFLPAWDGRYYWDYPNYTANARMGGEAGFRRLITESQKLGFKMMPMFGTNAANRKQSVWPTIAPGATYKIDGDVYNINWVDWNNDRHQDGWLAYMNLGADTWRSHLEARIADVIERYGVDAYFLDIVGGHVNSTTGDMHEGTKRLVRDLRERFPKVVPVGEMPYDALHGFIPMFQAGFAPRWQKYSAYFQHLSAPAPGRGSSGVHESGFSKFNDATMGVAPNRIPTLQVVEDTFSKHRVEMAAIISAAKSRIGDRG